MGKLIAVVSGKGGVGKTTVSGGLACALSGMGRSVLLLDGDFELGNIDLTLGISPPVQGLMDVLNGWTDACLGGVHPCCNRNSGYGVVCLSLAEEPAQLCGAIPGLLTPWRRLRLCHRRLSAGVAPISKGWGRCDMASFARLRT